MAFLAQFGDAPEPHVFIGVVLMRHDQGNVDAGSDERFEAVDADVVIGENDGAHGANCLRGRHEFK